MSDAEKPTAPASRAGTPFDSPWFFPIAYGLFAIWFGYDGWLDPKTEAVTFNRVGAVVWLALFAWSLVGALRGRRRRGAPPAS